MPAFAPELLLARLTSLPAARVGWIAYSGGLDSSVLLHALARIRDRLAFEPRALHLDHGLHEDSPGWAEHCAHICARLGVAFRTRRLALAPAPGASLEAVARQARYAAMAELLEPGDLLLTAHHRDDQAETLLLALLRGSGPAGLAAMPPVAPLGPGRLVRPLLEFGRAELLAYAKDQGLHWLEDPSNRNLRFDRNFLRHAILPRLAERWPAATAGIARSAAHCAEAQTLIDSVAHHRMSEVAGQRPGTLSIPRLLELELPLRKAVLRQWLRHQDRIPPASRTPDSRKLGRILTEVMTARPDANPQVAWPGCQIRRYRDDLFAMAPLPPLPAPDPLPWSKGILILPAGLGQLELLAPDGQILDPREIVAKSPLPGRERTRPERNEGTGGEGDQRIEGGAKGKDRHPLPPPPRDDLAPGLEIRFGVAGLSCRPMRHGRRRSLKKLYQEQGIPPWIRPYIPLIFAQGTLIAVGNLWVCYSENVRWKREFRIEWKSDLCSWYK